MTTSLQHRTDPPLVATELSDEDFAELVAQDVRNQASPDVIAMLRQPEHLDRWYDALVELGRTVDFQFVGQRAETYEHYQRLSAEEFATYYGQILRWKTSTVRFKRAIEARIADCRSLRRQRTQRFAGLATQLAQAIADHHHAAVSADTMENADETLWAQLEDPRVRALLNHP